MKVELNEGFYWKIKPVQFAEDREHMTTEVSEHKKNMYTVFPSCFFHVPQSQAIQDGTRAGFQLLMSKYLGSAGKSCSTRSSPSSESECL